MKALSIVLVSILPIIAFPHATFGQEAALTLPGQSSEQAPVPEVRDGEYRATGTSPSGKYTNSAFIVKDGESYQVLWPQESNEHLYGTGIVFENMLAITVYVESGQTIGVVLYKITGETLTGKWTQVNIPNGAVFEETMTKVGDVPKEMYVPRKEPASKPRQNGRIAN